MGLQSHIYVPATVEQWSIDAIKSEGSGPVTPVDADYDGAVAAASDASDAAGSLGVLIQDMSWDGYQLAPARITLGYMAISSEIESQASIPPTAVVVPVGVGSLAHSVVQWFHRPESTKSTRIITAEPDAAPCLHESLKNGKETTTPGTRFTVMPGLNCGTVSPLAWPDLQAAVKPQDAMVVTDVEAEQAVKDLIANGVSAGPCGAAPLAAARKVQFKADDVVVLICTEGQQDK